MKTFLLLTALLALPALAQDRMEVRHRTSGTAGLTSTYITLDNTLTGTTSTAFRSAIGAHRDPDYARRVDTYGADPTGATDSTAAFNLARAAAGRAPILLGSGTYKTTGFVLTKPGGIVGAGVAATHILVTGTGDGISLSGTLENGTFAAGGAFGFLFKDFTISGTNGNTNRGAGVKLVKGTDDFFGLAINLDGVTVRGFHDGFYVSNTPTVTGNQIAAINCRVGVRLRKPDSVTLRGLDVVARRTFPYNGDSSMPAITGTETCTAIDIAESAGTPGGAGFAATQIENLEVGDVDEVLRNAGNTPVSIDNVNAERIGDVNAPPEGDHLAYINGSLARYRISNWRVGGTPTGVSGSSCFVHVVNQLDAAPIVRLEGMSRANLGANYVGAIITGTTRGQVILTGDGSNNSQHIRKLTMASANDDGYPVAMPPFSQNSTIRGAQTFKGAWEDFTFDNYGADYAGLGFSTYGTKRWSVHAHSTGFGIWDVLNSRYALDFSTSGATLYGTTSLGVFSGTGSNITLTGNTAITGTLTLPSIIIPLIADDEATLLSATNLVTNAAYYAEDTGKLVVSGSGGVPSVVRGKVSGTNSDAVTWTAPHVFGGGVITGTVGSTYDNIGFQVEFPLGGEATNLLDYFSGMDIRLGAAISRPSMVTSQMLFYPDDDLDFVEANVTGTESGMIAFVENSASNHPVMTVNDGTQNLYKLDWDGSIIAASYNGHTLATGTDAIVTRTGTTAKADSLVTGGTSTGVVLASSTIASPTFSGTSGGTVTRTGTFIGGVHQSGTYTGAMTVSSGTLTIADTATIAGLARLLADRSIVVLRDEFVGGNISSYSELGELGWRMANIHGSNSFALVQGHSGRPGVYQVNATTGSGTNALDVYLNAGSNGANAFNNLSAEANWQLDWSLALTSTATEIVRVGFFNTNSSMSLNRAVFIRYDTSAGDTTFKGVTVQSGTVASTVDLGVTPAASTFYNLRLRAGTAGTVYFSVNGGTEYSATVSNAGTLQLGVQLQTLEAVQKSLYLDYFSFFQTGLAR
jgi:hypothetical protein